MLGQQPVSMTPSLLHVKGYVAQRLRLLSCTSWPTQLQLLSPSMLCKHVQTPFRPGCCLCLSSTRSAACPAHTPIPSSRSTLLWMRSMRRWLELRKRREAAAELPSPRCSLVSSTLLGRRRPGKSASTLRRVLSSKYCEGG